MRWSQRRVEMDEVTLTWTEGSSTPNVRCRTLPLLPLLAARFMVGYLANCHPNYCPDDGATLCWFYSVFMPIITVAGSPRRHVRPASLMWSYCGGGEPAAALSPP